MLEKFKKFFELFLVLRPVPEMKILSALTKNSEKAEIEFPL